jgi:hypothetical protein
MAAAPESSEQKRAAALREGICLGSGAHEFRSPNLVRNVILTSCAYAAEYDRTNPIREQNENSCSFTTSLRALAELHQPQEVPWYTGNRWQPSHASRIRTAEYAVATDSDEIIRKRSKP